MIVVNDVLGYKNRKIYQDDNYFKFSIDGVLLANFVKYKLTTKKVLDIGTGTGIIPLILTMKSDVVVDAIEIQKELVELFRKTIEINHLDKSINLIHDDIRNYSTQSENLNKYDIVISNPPYFSKEQNKTIKDNAKHENFLSLEELIIASKKILKDRGFLYLIYNTARLHEIFNLLELNNFSISTLRFIHDTVDKPSKLVLIEASKNGNTMVKVLQPFVLYEKNGIMTIEYSNICQGLGEE